MRIALLFLVIVLATASSLMGRHLSDAQVKLVPEEVRLEAAIPRPSTARFLSLGHQEAAADLLWLHALGYFGENLQHAVRQDEVDWLSPHIDAIIAVDPRFRMIYIWAGTVPFYDQGGRERVEIANHYLRRGIEVFPTDPALHLMLGINLLQDMRPRNDQERFRFLQEAGRHFRMAAQSPGAPPHALVLATTFDRRLDLTEDRFAGVAASLLRAERPETVRSLRAEAERQAAPAEVAQAVLLRHIHRSATEHPWIAGANSYPALAFHPEPSLATPADLMHVPHLLLAR